MDVVYLLQTISPLQIGELALAVLAVLAGVILLMRAEELDGADPAGSERDRLQIR